MLHPQFVASGIFNGNVTDDMRARLSKFKGTIASAVLEKTPFLSAHLGFRIPCSFSSKCLHAALLTLHASGYQHHITCRLWVCVSMPLNVPGCSACS